MSKKYTFKMVEEFVKEHKCHELSFGAAGSFLGHRLYCKTCHSVLNIYPPKSVMKNEEKWEKWDLEVNEFISELERKYGITIGFL